VYLNNLYAGRADEYLAYLERRKIAPSTMKKFGLGASLDYSSLPSYLLGLGYTPEECAESGACTRTTDGRLIDAEGERLIFPIINQMDEVIAFGGRLLKKSENRGKYTNTRETLLFNKGKNLYNINLVKKEKRAAGLSSIIMLEGYMDVMSLYQAGFKNVVANMGTALTKEQARLCKRYSENVYACYDGDFAGIKANLRGLDIFKQEGITVRVVPMPEGLDPDEVIRDRGVEGYQACLDQAMPVIDYRIYATEQKHDLTRTEGRREFVKEVLPIVREAESETEREELLKRIAAVSQVSYSALVRDLENVPAPETEEPKAQMPKEDNADRERKASYFVLAACLLSKPYALGCKLEEFDFTGDLKTIADFITQERAAGRVRPSGIFDLLGADSKELSEVLGLDYGDNLDGESAERYFRDCVRTLKRKALSDKIAAKQAELKTAQTTEERNAILIKISEYTKELQTLNIGGRK
ncbi:MAG: toprim domain-containing protein, partial [Clostridiales bacterium]|nr:toprim domain-containing protein [Clostridiales bacterium]